MAARMGKGRRGRPRTKTPTKQQKTLKDGPGEEVVPRSSIRQKIETPRPPEPAPEVLTDLPDDPPEWIDREHTEFMVSTDDYREVVRFGNVLTGGMFSEHRVGPGIFIDYLRQLKEYYGRS